jgi:hypothetical protein
MQVKLERYVNAGYFHSLAECQEYASFFPLSYQGKWNLRITASKEKFSILLHFELICILPIQIHDFVAQTCMLNLLLKIAQRR